MIVFFLFFSPIVLSITHRLGLFFNKIPSSGNIPYSLPATPDNYDTGFAISLATQKATQFGNPMHRLAHSTYRFR